jgi:hypothetical protein
MPLKWGLSVHLKIYFFNLNPPKIINNQPVIINKPPIGVIGPTYFRSSKPMRFFRVRM